MSKQKKIRLDELLVCRGVFPDTECAVRAILARKVKVADAYATSGAQKVSSDVEIEVQSKKRYVSRGGLKLEAALQAFHQDVAGMRCIDIGSSTGGFTDCLLQKGASQVTCVDVNYGQLAWVLRRDERVVIFERTNVRHVDPLQLGAPFDCIVADVSFIGLAPLAATLARLSAAGTVFIGLIKPQFESRRGETDHGIVRDPVIRRQSVEVVKTALDKAGFAVTGVIDSPLLGAKGNAEYLVHAIYGTAAHR